MSDPEAHPVFLSLLSAILSYWLAGLLWGANAVLYCYTVPKIGPGAAYGFQRALTFFLSLGMILSAIQACMGFADLLLGFAQPSPIAAEYFAAQQRPFQLAQVVFFVCSYAIGDSFVVWRVYMAWGRNKLSMIVLVLLILAAIATSLTTVAQFKHGSTFSINSLAKFSLAAWSCSLAVQIIGLSLLTWRAVSTPVVSIAGPRRRCSIWPFVWIIVDSGCLYICVEIMAIVFLVQRPLLSRIPIGMHSQISVTVSLTITLREWWKRSHLDPKAHYPIPFFVENRARSRPASLQTISCAESEDGMVVAIRTTTQVHDDVALSRSLTKEGSHLELEDSNTFQASKSRSDGLQDVNMWISLSPPQPRRPSREDDGIQ